VLQQKEKKLQLYGKIKKASMPRRNRESFNTKEKKKELQCTVKSFNTKERKKERWPRRERKVRQKGERMNK
jgi:hypothetical protein